LDDSDAFSQYVYDLGARARHIVRTRIGRAFVDPNRAREDLPPDNPDGVIKSHTCYWRPIYKAGSQPDAALIERLLTKYYDPYHREIQAALAEDESSRVQLALDCHTMTPIGPDVAPDPGGKRPMVCLGDAYGSSCSQEEIDRLADCFRQAFDLKPSDVTQNEPFAGGYITRYYGGHPAPWIQIEMNVELYLDPPCVGRQELTIDPNHPRLVEARTRFEKTLRLYFDEV
jgi:formiminoglutamase